jgi:hypothetical protein
MRQLPRRYVAGSGSSPRVDVVRPGGGRLHEHRRVTQSFRIAEQKRCRRMS